MSAEPSPSSSLQLAAIAEAIHQLEQTDSPSFCLEDNPVVCQIVEELADDPREVIMDLVGLSAVYFRAWATAIGKDPHEVLQLIALG